MFYSIMGPLLMGLFIFLIGMKIMELSLHLLAASYLKRILERFTETPLRGMITGTGLTALLQSSSAITAITIGLVNSGLLTFPRTLGIILGTNIGTCITTELIGLDIIHYAIKMLWISSIFSLVLWLIPAGKQHHRSIWQRGLSTLRFSSLAVSGFSCVMLGMKMMSSIAPLLQSTGFFTWFLEYAGRSMIWGIIAGAILTAIIQSSAAAIAMTMGFASVQAISLELGMAMIIGSNIGTCVTGFIASIGGSKSGQFVAWSHFVLNVGGALLFYPLIVVMKEWVELLAEVPSMQLAHFQTLFNILCSVLALPLCYLPIWKRIDPKITHLKL